MSTICELKNKLDEVSTLVSLISSPEKQEAISLWNNAASKIEHIVNFVGDSIDQTTLQNQESCCERETGSTVTEESNMTLACMIEESDVSPNSQSMPVASEFDSIIDIISLDQPVDRHYEFGDILGDSLFTLTSNTCEDNMQAQQDVIAEDISPRSVPEPSQPERNIDHDSSDRAMAGPICLSSSSASIFDSQIDGLQRNLMVPMQHSSFNPSSDAGNQVLADSRTTGSSHVMDDNPNLPVSSYSDCDNPALETMQHSEMCDVANNIGQSRLDRDFDVASDVTHLGVPSARNLSVLTSNPNFYASDVRPLQQLQIYVPRTMLMNAFIGSEDPGRNQLDDQTARDQTQLSLAATTHFASNSSPHIVDHSQYPGQAPSAKADIDSVPRPQPNSNPDACEVCGKTGFSTRGNLKRHQKTHSGEKPFACSLCNRSFTEKKGLKVHLRTHSGERPFNCEICHKQFTQAHMLKDHMTIHTNERKFPCSKCDKSFRQNSQLKLHSMRHDGIKKLECTSCPRKFVTRGDLKRHTRTHTGEKPYTCSLCKTTFTRQQSLNEHLNRHTGKRPYSCTHCGQEFSEMSACYKHIKMHAREGKTCQSVVSQTQPVSVL